jgi:hypothetical protein
MRIQAYGRYLNFLTRRGLLVASEGPRDRMVPARLTLYLGEAQELLSARSLSQNLQELRRMMQVLVPAENWVWITRHSGRPSPREIRLGRKVIRIFDPRELCCRALDLMDHIERGPLTYELLISYRNALIVVIQCIFALRRRNLAEMVLGANLIVEEEIIRVVFTSRETKNYLPVNLMAPNFFRPYLLKYLNEYRPVLLSGNVSDAVWINHNNQPLEYGAIAFLIRSIGMLLLGRPLNCHAFRHSVATAILSGDPRKMKVASGTLNHVSLRSVNTHYDLSGDEGSRKVWNKLRRDIIRGKGF